MRSSSRRTSPRKLRVFHHTRASTIHWWTSSSVSLSRSNCVLYDDPALRTCSSTQDSSKVPEHAVTEHRSRDTAVVVSGPALWGCLPGSHTETHRLFLRLDLYGGPNLYRPPTNARAQLAGGFHVKSSSGGGPSKSVQWSIVLEFRRKRRARARSKMHKVLWETP